MAGAHMLRAELMPLEGRLVEIHGLQGALDPSPETQAAQPGVGPVEVNGAKGRTLAWSSTDGKYIVETFDGLIVGVPEENLHEFEPPDLEHGGFDVAWPSASFPADVFAEEVAACIEERGFCVIQMFSTQAVRAQAKEQSLRIGKWHLTTKELEVPYHGLQNRTKYANLEPDDFRQEVEDGLSKCDRTLTNLGLMLGPWMPAYVGCTLYGRHSGMLRVSLESPEEEALLRPGPLEDRDYDPGGKVYGHINFLERRRLCAMYVIEGGGGELVLCPDSRLGFSDMNLPLERNRLVVFRPDLLNYSYKPTGSSLLLQTWYMGEPFIAHPDDQRAVALPQLQQGRRTHVTTLYTRFGGGGLSQEETWNLWVAGTDGAQKLPILRFDIDEYYAGPSKDSGKPLYNCHSSCVDDSVVQTFDNEIFGIPHVEADSMSSSQRNLLEVGLSTLLREGYSPEDLKGLHCGTYLGFAGTDWLSRQLGTMLISGAMGLLEPSIRNGSNMGVDASRLSYALGMRGPTVGMDTACSSSLVATTQAHRSMTEALADQRRSAFTCELSKAVVMGCCLDDGLDTYFAYCGAQMLSIGGRSFTFDESATGFSRGEGIAGTFLSTSDKDEDLSRMLACIIGSNVNQDGRSASMTAPNGPSQQRCIRNSMEQAGLKPSMITIAECHGTGTALGDPIEVSALRDVMKDRDIPIIVTSAKSNFGHMEACAGIGGVARCVLMLLGMCGAPNLHLKLLNPHIEHDGFPALFISELQDCGCNVGISGVSSFGIGGTNARGDLWGRAQLGPRFTNEVHTTERLALRALKYTRVKQYGTPGPAAADRVFITGTWDCWSSMECMDNTADGVYVVTVMLGEAGRERFRIVLNENPSESFYPADFNADQSAEVQGPDWKDNKRSWLIDGRLDGATAGTVYTIKFQWSFSWDLGELKRVSWEQTHSGVTPQIDGRAYSHRYFMTGKCSTWQLHEMVPSGKEDPGVFSIQLRIGVTGEEEFKILRDRDWTQAIYPAVDKAYQPHVPVMGPDSQGEGKSWCLQGSTGECWKIELHVSETEIAVKAICTSARKGARIWRSSTVMEELEEVPMLEEADRV